MADSIKKLTDLFAKFPTVGPRTAGRFVFYLINKSKQDIDELVTALQELKNNVKLCEFCFNPHELQSNLCAICSDNQRNQQLLCVVEKETDLASLENTRKYKGRYFILGGVLTLRKKAEDLRLEALKKRIKETPFSEIIIAINPTPEGKATSLLVKAALLI
jgi:recombination protein RecR